MMKHIFFLILFYSSLFLRAQDLGTMMFSEYSTDYFGQLTDNKKNKDGLGIQRLNNGNIYAGGIKMNKFDGIGLMIIGTNGAIDNCKDAYTYAGEWKNGKKDGKGRLYNKNGILIYDGLFANDIPIETYPNKNLDSNYRFGYLEIEENEEREEQIYIGETKCGKSEGLGLTFDNEGFVSFSEFNNGVENGLAIMIYPPTNWFTFKVKNGRWFQISSSTEQIKRNTKNKSILAEQRSKIKQALGDVLDASSQIIETFSQKENIAYTNTNIQDIPSRQSNNSPSSSANSKKYNMGEQNSYNTDKRTWGNYDSMLAAHFAGNKPATKNDVKQWQQKMSSLRSKWTSKGKSFPNSSNENRSISGCASSSHSH